MSHTFTMNSPVNTDRPALAKIVATVGPASDSPEIIGRLIEEGVSVFRLNFSHGSLDEHEVTLGVIREAAQHAGRPVAVMGDLPGPKIRVGKVPGDGIMLSPGDTVFIGGTDNNAVRNDNGVVLPCTYVGAVEDVDPGQRVLINDGAIRMLSVDRLDEKQAEQVGVAGNALQCAVTTGGLVTSGKGINLPDCEVSAPAVSERDWACVQWAVKHGIDYLAMSFVRRPEEIIELRKYLDGVCSLNFGTDQSGEGSKIPIIAKIEKPQALDRIEQIIEAADAIMVARGDLGVEMDLALVPVIQKQLIDLAGQWGKPCIVATQMLETMIHNSSPTRAEVSDVANAIFDGADAVMLSAETAMGDHPSLVVSMMHRIIAASESRIRQLLPVNKPQTKLIERRIQNAAISHGAWRIAQDIKASLVVCWSETGHTARLLSQNEFGIPIVAFSSSKRQTQRMALLRGVVPIRATPPGDGSISEWELMVEAQILGNGWARKGDAIVMVAGDPVGQSRTSKHLAIHHLGTSRSDQS